MTIIYLKFIANPYKFCKFVLKIRFNFFNTQNIMKNLIKLSLFFSFMFVVTLCFSQEKLDTNKSVGKTEMNSNVTNSKEVKSKKSKSPSSKGKQTGVSNKIAVSDHGLPAEKSSTKKSTDKDKAVVPKKTN